MSSGKASSFKSDIFFWQSIFCDLVVFLLSVFLTDMFTPLLEKEILDPNKSIGAYSSKIGWLYIDAVFAQTIGLWLMRPVIRRQMQSEGAPNYGAGSFAGAILLLVMHFVIFGILFTWDGFQSIWGNVSGIKMILPILLCALPTISALIISFPGDKEKPLTAMNKWMGWLGTLLLTFSIVIVSQACWHILFDGQGASLHNASIIGNILITILFGFLFLLMYLPPRYGFIITDYNKGSAWLRILLVYAPFGWQVLTGK